MKNIKLENTKVKRNYMKWLIGAKGFNPSTVDQMMRPIYLYESTFANEDFGLFNNDRAEKFKEILDKRLKEQKLSANSIRTYLTHLKKYYEWLITQPGYKSKISSSSLEYLRVSKKANRLAAQRVIRKYPSKEYIIELVNSIDAKNDVDKRDRAVIAFTFLTGIRDAAIISLPIGCIDLERMSVEQNPHFNVNTKSSKIIYSRIFKFDEQLFEIVIDWINHLRKKGYSKEDPLFPRSKSEQIDNGYSFKEAKDFEPSFWSTTNSIRKIFKERTQKANLPYYPPHTFRHSAIADALKLARNGEEIKAVSQNFGHEDLGTTLSVYANLLPEQLLNVLENMESNKKEIAINEDLQKMIVEVHKKLTS